jgi:signal transduction histidine kinase
MQHLHEALGTQTEARYDLVAGVPFALPDSSVQRLAEAAHDARNMVTALGLYCELLEEPGVLTAEFRHYGGELRLLVATSRRLVDKLMAMNRAREPEPESPLPVQVARWEQAMRRTQRSGADRRLLPDTLIGDLALELESSRNLLCALAGPGIELSLNIAGGALPVRLSSEDLTRILVNLMKNAVEAMPTGGRLQLNLREAPAAPGENPRVLLTVEDNGPGIVPEMLEQVFEPGYSTRSKPLPGQRSWTSDHLGLGLSITRSLVEAAGGRIHAASRDPVGACFQMELPVRAG